MRIYKKYSAIIEWSLAVILIIVCYKLTFSGSFTPLKAHEQSERTAYYGPSDIVKTIELDKEKIYLCRYKDWFSASTVKKELIKWYPTSQAAGIPIDYSKQVSYGYNSSSGGGTMESLNIYGYVSDPNISTMLFENISKTTSIPYYLDESRMFIFNFRNVPQENKSSYLKGLDSDGNVIYEEEVVGF